jgi:hypothetical protein
MEIVIFKLQIHQYTKVITYTHHPSVYENGIGATLDPPPNPDPPPDPDPDEEEGCGGRRDSHFILSYQIYYGNNNDYDHGDNHRKKSSTLFFKL